MTTHRGVWSAFRSEVPQRHSTTGLVEPRPTWPLKAVGVPRKFERGPAVRVVFKGGGFLILLRPYLHTRFGHTTWRIKAEALVRTRQQRARSRHNEATAPAEWQIAAQYQKRPVVVVASVEIPSAPAVDVLGGTGHDHEAVVAAVLEVFRLELRTLCDAKYASSEECRAGTGRTGSSQYRSEEGCTEKRRELAIRIVRN